MLVVRAEGSVHNMRFVPLKHSEEVAARDGPQARRFIV